MPRARRSVYSAKHLLYLAALLVLVFKPPARAQERPHSPPPATTGKAAAVTIWDPDLIGRVRRVRIDRAKIVIESGKAVESSRELLRETIYNRAGAVIDDATYSYESPMLEGKAEYKYDDKGNVSELTLRNDDGSVLRKEVYTYEFDAVGNWKKRVTSAAVAGGGETRLAPTEVVYRTITYYFDDTIAQKLRPAPPTRAAPGQPPVWVPGGTAGAENKPQADALLASNPNMTGEQSALRQKVTPPTGTGLSKMEGLADSQPRPDAESVANRAPTYAGAGKPPSLGLHSAEALRDSGLAYYKAGQYEKAVEALKLAALRDPASDEVRRSLDMVSADLSRLSREAAARKDAAAQYDIGNAYSRLGQFEYAAEAYDQAIRLGMKDPDLYNELGIAYGEMGRYEEAVRAFKQAVRMRPDLAEAHNNIGLTYYRMGRHEEAVKSFRRAINYQPAGAEAQYNLGLAYLAAGDRRAAVEQHKTLKAVAPELAAKLLEEISKRVPVGGSGIRDQ